MPMTSRTDGFKVTDDLLTIFALLLSAGFGINRGASIETKPEPLHTSTSDAHPSRMLFALKAPLLLYPFLYFDPVRKRWIRARYVAERHESESRYAQWEITGPPEIRTRGGEREWFNPWAKMRPRPEAHLPPDEEP